MHGGKKEEGDSWKDSPFHRLAGEYDSWFDGSAVFRAELACLRDLAVDLPVPRLEIGVGPGRFAEALGLGFGMDPAFGALRLAAKRGIKVFAGMGEALPLADGRVGTVALLFSLCFVADPAKVLQEAHRVLQPAGLLVVGMVPSTSSWGRAIADKQKKGHPFYRQVHLLRIDQAMEHLEGAGFTVAEQRSALLRPPSAFDGEVDSRSGIAAEAGFVVLVGRKGER